MKIIVLAAGQGTRLSPLTDDQPKCMVAYNDQPIIDYILDACKDLQIDQVNIVNGYRHEVLEDYLSSKEIQFYYNSKFETTNMVSSLFCAEEEMDDDIIISYSDIIYDKKILKKLIDSSVDIGVVIDKDWERLWSIRMDDVLLDAESLKVRDGLIKEIGKKASSLADIEGQYIGLIKISKQALKKVREFYHSLDRDGSYDGKDFSNMYMTSFIQKMIDSNFEIRPIYINGGWLEIDSVEDLNAYTEAKVLF